MCQSWTSTLLVKNRKWSSCLQNATCNSCGLVICCGSSVLLMCIHLDIFKESFCFLSKHVTWTSIKAWQQLVQLLAFLFSFLAKNTLVWYSLDNHFLQINHFFTPHVVHIDWGLWYSPHWVGNNTDWTQVNILFLYYFVWVVYLCYVHA